ncbi:unnamed protein product [Onchocerca flexuosa]|uniref:Uncharacterized protein n=1 Tax=Onchocerca flexuosa TaxID=387005 RepID=A0A183HPL1_9BILA|nr:unnamed protein product [Onchocerca flexuosa]
MRRRGKVKNSKEIHQIYIGPVHPQTNECLKSPPLTIKNLHHKQNEQNQLQPHQLGYPRNQFSPAEADENYYYDTAIQEVPYSGRQHVSRTITMSSQSHPIPSLRRTQPCLRSQPPLSPSPPPRLVTISEKEFSAEITDSNEMISNNNFAKLNIYGNPAVRNVSACNTTSSDDVVQKKKSVRNIIEFENDALKKIGRKEKVILLNLRSHSTYLFI